MADDNNQQGGTPNKPPRMPDGDDPRSGNEIKSLLASGSKNSKTTSHRDEKR